MLRSTSLLLGLLSILAACAPPPFRPLDPTAKHAVAGAVAWWYGNDTAAVDLAEKPLSQLLDKKCALRKMGAEKSAFFVRVAAEADRIIKSPAFASRVKAKRDWQLTSDSGAQIMERLRWTGVQVNVFMYARDADHPCEVKDLIDGHTNAFTPMTGDGDVHLLFLYEPYFAAAMKLNDVPEVARTIVHESLHSMGYSHAGTEVGSERYNNTVPLYIGCMIEHWGGKLRQDWVDLNCHKADAAREKPPGG